MFEADWKACVWPNLVELFGVEVTYDPLPTDAQGGSTPSTFMGVGRQSSNTGPDPGEVAQPRRLLVLDDDVPTPRRGDRFTQTGVSGVVWVVFDVFELTAGVYRLEARHAQDR